MVERIKYLGRSANSTNPLILLRFFSNKLIADRSALVREIRARSARRIRGHRDRVRAKAKADAIMQVERAKALFISDLTNCYNRALKNEYEKVLEISYLIAREIIGDTLVNVPGHFYKIINDKMADFLERSSAILKINSINLSKFNCLPEHIRVEVDDSISILAALLITPFGKVELDLERELKSIFQEFSLQHELPKLEVFEDAA